jgi:hypothetical protein
VAFRAVSLRDHLPGANTVSRCSVQAISRSVELAAEHVAAAAAIAVFIRAATIAVGKRADTYPLFMRARSIKPCSANLSLHELSGAA